MFWRSKSWQLYRDLDRAADLAHCLPRRVTAEQIAWFFVAIGVVVRLVRYGLAFPLWADEYQLAANFLDRGFRELLRPLDHNQVAPVGFLWIELAATRLFGISELSLRLFPALCGIAGVFLFRHVASRLLSGVPFVLAVAIFAVAYYPIRHSAEVKPYSSDLFLSLILLSLAVEWWRTPGRSRCLWLLAATAPVALTISFTTAFVAGGISLGIAYTVFTRRGLPGVRSAGIAWLAFNLAVGVTFLGLMRLSIGAQYDATRSAMTDCWADGFPPWQQPLTLALWLIDVHTGPMFAYPFGAQHGGSILTLVCFSIGLVELFRRGRCELAITVVAMFGLSLVAAALHRYPYGSHARLSQYLAPLICLLTGMGAAKIIVQLPVALAGKQPVAPQDGSPTSDARTVAVRLALFAGLLMAVGMLTRDVLHPFKSKLDRDHRTFARSFWTAAPDQVTLCVKADLKRSLYSDSFETAYFCHQRIYSPAHRNGPQPAADILAAANQPLRCVLFHSDSAVRNDAAFADWMDQMTARYDLTGTERHEWPLSDRHDEHFGYYLQCYDVYHFEPKLPLSSPVRPVDRWAETGEVRGSGTTAPERR